MTANANNDPRPDGTSASEPLEPDGLTWAVLLAKWTEFARASVALPEAGEAGRVRRSVTDIIALQAVWFALRQLDELDRAERSMGLDRAGVLIDRHTSAIAARFAGGPMPAELQDLIDDVRAEYTSQKAG
jgi:hypothetical protein